MDFKNKKLIPIAIFGGLVLTAVIIRLNPPAAPQRPAFSGPMMTVETRVVAETNYPIVLESYGTVQPRTRSILVAQVGIAGSTTLGDYVVVGGQAGLADHLVIGDRVMIGARSGVHRSLAGDQIVSGVPAMPHEIAIKAQALISRLPDLRRQVRDLEQRVRTIESRTQRGHKRPRSRK